MVEKTTRFVAECFWPGVNERDLRALDTRVNEEVAVLAAQGNALSYLGAMLMREDEVVLCEFEGTAAAVQIAVEHAAVPCERLVEITSSPHRISTTDDPEKPSAPDPQPNTGEV
jgi:hypothetical protein